MATMNGFFRRARAVAQKEMRHLLRDPRTLLLVFVQPVALMILYGYAFSFDLRRLPFIVWDQDHSEPARQLVRQLSTHGKEPPFALVSYVTGPEEIEPLLAGRRARFALVIPRGFGEKIGAGKTVTVQALFDATETNVAGVTTGYLSGAIARYNARLANDWIGRRGGAHLAGPAFTRSVDAETSKTAPIDLRWRVFYNPDLDSVRFVVPGLIGILLTFVASTMTCTCIVRERELGPMESLLTAPLSASELVIGKLAPYIVVAAGNIAVVLLVGGLWFQVWPRGDPLTLASFSLLFLVGMLAIGMLISARARTQFLALTGAALVTLLPNLFLTGFIFPRSNMHPILQPITAALPATQYLIAIRGVFLKGTGWSVHWPQGLWLALISIVLVLLSIRLVRASMARGLG
jgi:ABC-2 type transport system permease protein